MTRLHQILNSKYGFDMNQMKNWGTDYEVDPENYGKLFKYSQNRQYKYNQTMKLKMLINLGSVQKIGFIYAAIKNIKL